MAGTTIGRVEFIVDLDGKKIPGQARKIAQDIAKAGKSAGDDFGSEFESSFTHRLSSIGAQWSDTMRKQGRLSSETFMQSFENGMRSRQSRIQTALADAVGDKDSFAAMLSSFDNIDEGVDRVIKDLEDLTRAKIKSRNADGDLVTQSVLTKTRFEQLVPVIRAMGAELKVTREQEAELEKQTERLDADIARLTRTVGDTDAFRIMADRVGSSATAYQRLKNEIEGLNDAGAINITQMERLVDTLDKTRESADSAAQAERDLARAQREAADEAARQKDRLDRLNGTLTDIDRKMGNLDAYRDRVKEMGNVGRATDDLKASFDKLRDLGASERSIVGLHNKLNSFNKTLEKDKDKPNAWARVMQKATEKVASAWRRMDGTVKLVLVSILGAGPEVAALGSALGAGLIAVGAAATSMVVGVAAAIAVFSNLLQDIEDAPDSMKPAIRSFGAFKASLESVNDAIAQAAFDQMGDAFIVLGQNIKALEPALAKAGGALGKLIKGFAEGTREGTDAFVEINKAIELAGPNLESLGGIVGKFGTALLRAFNRAQPLVEDLFGWLGKLTDRFDAFTQSDDFADWVSNAQRVWGAFSGTLDAVSKALSDLVTPEAVDNTVKLLENIERLAPSIGNLLSIFGALDPIGLLVDIFADIGEAMAPLTPMLVGLATGLNNVIEAIPAGVWLAAAGAVTALSTALVGMKLASIAEKALAPLLPTLQGMFAALKPLPDAITGTSRGLSTLGKAGVVGAAVVGFLALAEAAKGWARELADIDGTVRTSLASHESLISTVDELSGAAEGLSPHLTDIDGAFENLSRWQGNVFENIGAAFDEGAKGAHDLNAGLKELDNGMKGLPLEDQAKHFSAWAKELGATDEQVLQMLDSTPQFKQALLDASDATGQMAEGTDLAKLALEGMVPDAEEAGEAISDIGESTGRTITSIDELASAIRGFGDTTLTTNEAARNYEASLDELSASIEENTNTWDIGTEAGRANLAAVDDVAQSTKDYAAAILEQTGSSEQANAALDTGRTKLIEQLTALGWTAEAANEYADKVGLIPAAEALAQAALSGTHADLINALEQFGLTGEEAVIYAGKVEAIPDGAETLIEMLNVDPSIDDAEDVKKSIDDIPKDKKPKIIVENADKSKEDADKVKKSMDNVNSKTVSLNVTSNATADMWTALFGRHARGTVTKGMEFAMIGEEGPEAVVPLNRPLNQVDPSVRALSAVAQGKMTVNEFNGGGDGGGKSTGNGGTSRIVNISPGAIVVQGSLAPEATATMTVNRIAERIAG